MPLVEEQIRRQRSKAAVPQQEWQMTERLKCQPDPPDLLLTIVQGLEQFAHDYEHHCEIARSRGLQPISSKRACEALRKIEEAIERLWSFMCAKYVRFRRTSKPSRKVVRNPLVRQGVTGKIAPHCCGWQINLLLPPHSSATNSSIRSRNPVCYLQSFPRAITVSTVIH